MAYFQIFKACILITVKVEDNSNAEHKKIATLDSLWFTCCPYLASNNWFVIIVRGAVICRGCRKFLCFISFFCRTTDLIFSLNSRWFLLNNKIYLLKIDLLKIYLIKIFQLTSNLSLLVLLSSKASAEMLSKWFYLFFHCVCVPYKEVILFF